MIEGRNPVPPSRKHPSFLHVAVLVVVVVVVVVDRT